MPALVNSSVGSFAGTSDEEWTSRCLFWTKKSRNLRRISEPVSIEYLILNERHTFTTRDAEKHRGLKAKSTDWRIADKGIEACRGNAVAACASARSPCRGADAPTLETFRGMRLQCDGSMVSFSSSVSVSSSTSHFLRIVKMVLDPKPARIRLRKMRAACF